jgi:filamentous hemagglutinin
VREALNYVTAPVSSYAIPSCAGLSGEEANDVNQSRSNVLNLVMTNPSAYGAINTIDARANFFGAMYQQTGASWFGAAAKTSVQDLMGGEFNFGNFLSGGGLADWRSQAGNLIMPYGYSSFVNVYQNYQSPSFNLNTWSMQQLTNEQNTLQSIYEQQGVFTRILILGGGEANYQINPFDVDQRIKFGCKRMMEFGYQGGGCH